MSDRSPQTSGEDLAEFVASGSHAAFRRLVEAWLPLVMGTALRRTGGQQETAEEIAQLVFIDLARRAKSMTPGRVSGWLYQHTCFTTAKALRAERRRVQRERVAAQNFAESPEPRTDRLDDLLLSMNETDREALLLRYVEGRRHEEVAEALGISRAAAQKRSERALERLRLTYRHGLTAAGLATLLAPPLTEAAELSQRLAGPALTAEAASKSLPFFTKPLASALWGVAAAITLSAVPLALAWRDYSAVRTTASARSALPPGPTPARTTFPAVARAAVYDSPDAVVSALLALADRYGLGDAATDRSKAIIPTVPREWVHEIALTLDRRMPHNIRSTSWHQSMARSLAEFWQPRRVPEDLISAWKVLKPQGDLNSMFKACAVVDLPATRKLLENFATEDRLGELHQRSVPHCALAEAVITQALKACPQDVAALFDKAPRMDWIGRRWEFPATQAIREATKDAGFRKLLTDSLPAMQDRRRRLLLENMVLSYIPVPERLAKVEAMTDPKQRAESATAVAGLNEVSLPWWERQVPVGMQPGLAPALAEHWRQDLDPDLVLGWIARMGEAAGGAEFDALRRVTVDRMRGNQGARSEQLATMAERISDPSLRATVLGDILRYGSANGEAWKQPWMEQHLTPGEQAEFTLIMQRKKPGE